MYYRQVLMASLWIKHHLSYRLTGKNYPKIYLKEFVNLQYALNEILYVVFRS